MDIALEEPSLMLDEKHFSDSYSGGLDGLAAFPLMLRHVSGRGIVRLVRFDLLFGSFAQKLLQVLADRHELPVYLVSSSTI
jgi:hypothetical protein